MAKKKPQSQIGEQRTNHVVVDGKRVPVTMRCRGVVGKQPTAAQAAEPPVDDEAAAEVGPQTDVGGRPA